MNVIIYKEDLVDGIIKASNIIPQKTGAAFLRTIWFKSDENSLKIMSTDSNVEFTGEYKAEVKEEGLIGTQGRKITDLIKKLRPEPITIKKQNDIVWVLQNKRQYKIPTSDSSWFPELEEFPGENNILCSGEKIKDFIEKSLFCISDDDSMQAMTCLKLIPGNENYVEVCAFNGHQLSLYHLENTEFREILDENGILIQKKYLIELRKWMPNSIVEISITESKIFFRTQDKRESFCLPLSMYQFPNYHQFIQTYENKFSSFLIVNRNELMESLERIQIFNTDIQMSTLIELGKEEIKLNSTAVESGDAQENISCEYEGDLDHIIFNTKGLLEILGHMEEENVKFSFAGQVLPCKISGLNDETYFVMTMPVQIEEETYYTEEEID